MSDVVLVDNNDREKGVTSVVSAHKGEGTLHRAVSVVAYRISKNGQEILMQKRSLNKILWPGVWSNTVCTHPLPGETTLAAAIRRLKEEMGIEVLSTELRFVMKMEYKAVFNESYAEHELDSIYLVRYSGNPVINPAEAAEYKWMGVGEMLADFEVNTASYTPWFRLMMGRERFREALKEGLSS